MKASLVIFTFALTSLVGSHALLAGMETVKAAQDARMEALNAQFPELTQNATY